MRTSKGIKMAVSHTKKRKKKAKEHSRRKPCGIRWPWVVPQSCQCHTWTVEGPFQWRCDRPPWLVINWRPVAIHSTFQPCLPLLNKRRNSPARVRRMQINSETHYEKQKMWSNEFLSKYIDDRWGKQERGKVSQLLDGRLSKFWPPNRWERCKSFLIGYFNRC